MYEVVVIGGGPAGLAATMYCVRKGIDVQLITATMGGKSILGLTLPDMSEYHVIKAREQVRTFQSGIEYLNHTWRLSKAAKIDALERGFRIALSDGSRVEAERLIVATGSTPTPLNVPGEREFFGKALGSSAISYSHLLRDQSVVVIGDSDRSIESAIECAEQAIEVTLVIEPHAKYSHRHLALADSRENIEIYNGYRVRRIEGDTFAEKIVICRGDETQKDCNPEKEIVASAFFVEREPRPNSRLVADLVELTQTGAIRINEKNETSNPRIFAAGDVTTVGIEQILIALGEGARAGLSAYRHCTLEI